MRGHDQPNRKRRAGSPENLPTHKIFLPHFRRWIRDLIFRKISEDERFNPPAFSSVPGISNRPRQRLPRAPIPPTPHGCARSLCCRAGSRSSSPASLSPCSPCAVFIAPLRALRLRLTLATNFITSHRVHAFGQASYLTGIPTASGLRSVLSGGLAICRILNPRE